MGKEEKETSGDAIESAKEKRAREKRERERERREHAEDEDWKEGWKREALRACC